ncbi:uncharacterized protein LOC118436492 isoform X3 [Folsomia candida]|uniref:G-protein coupled receptors family 1 profile domain-containing protein n=1 Tax=Folsomia candida TaxID=158441 RepID=A0A226F479_FOLCA|nr:uncharacterized protein LOC118436492 isoform X3 [Folsomia candida]XP_035710597.1 uncharacterized protein LOC118436492 isoform X3 [Folsomia candida]OXA63991.1 hypothetical protein Fcan01_01401 [Folsomia candida]
MAKEKVQLSELSLAAMGIFSVALNLTIAALVWRKSLSKKLIQEDFLILNASLTAAVASVIGSVYLFDNGSLLAGKLTCPVAALIWMFVINLIPTAVLGLNYERMRGHLKPAMKRLNLPLTLTVSWLIAILGAVPNYFSVVYNVRSKMCVKQKLLFGVKWAGLGYEIFRFFMVHVAVCIYIASDLYKVKSMFPYIYKSNAGVNDRLKQCVPRVRFLYINSVAFILTWIPFGMIITIYHNICFPPATKGVIDFPVTNFAMRTLFFVYLMVLPITIFGTNKELTKRTVYRVSDPNRRTQRIRIVRWRDRYGRGNLIDRGRRNGGGRQGGSSGTTDPHGRGGFGTAMRADGGYIRDLEEIEMRNLGTVVRSGKRSMASFEEELDSESLI